MQIGKKQFNLEEDIVIMGILNVTPDSFSDGGHFNQCDAALDHVETMLSEGADIIDIGGESTRPSHTPLGEEDELKRVIPMIEAIRKRFDVPISVDTYKAQVGKRALEAGADMINDVWGFKREPELAKVTACANVPCCLMHNRDNRDYTALIPDMITDLQASIDLALAADVKKEQIILDPGVGFAKDTSENLTVLNHLEAFRAMGYPVLLGTSRKSTIGNTLNLPVDERLEGTLATTVIGVMKGCSIFRVHDVLENRRAALMAAAIMKG